MMKRYALLAATAVVGAGVAFQGSVNLQATTPGTAQNGHLNVTGVAKAGTVVGYSPTLTGIAYGGDFRTVSDQGRGILGNASSLTGVTYGGLFQSFSTTGRGVAGIAVATSGFTVGGFFTTNSPTGKGIQGSSNATTGLNYGVYGRNLSPDGFALFGEGNVSATGIFSGNGSGLSNLNASNIDNGTLSLTRLPAPLALSGSQAAAGILSGTNSSTSGRGVYGLATAATGNAYGVFGETQSASGRGVLGLANAPTGINYGGYFDSDSTTGRGVYGSASATTGVNYGGYFDSKSPNGYGVYVKGVGEGLHVESSNGFYAARIINTGSSALRSGLYVKSTASDAAVFDGRITCSNDSTAVSASSIAGAGVQGYSNSVDNAGVYGSGLFAGVEGSGNGGLGTVGVYGGAFASNGVHYGVYGRTAFDSGRGVYGVYDASSNLGYGVRGYSNSATGYGVYSAGDFGASGTKSFVIDHPFDPANMYLKHYCAEGPEPKNIYDGTVVTDAKGWATIDLPDYFLEINKDPRVQLTVNDSSDDFVLVKMVGEFEGKAFRIRTSKGGVKVFWEVKATRNDAWVRKNGAPVEVQKDSSERGKYQHPELYGKPKEMGVDYDPKAGTRAAKRKNP
ncbi:MAG: hypothetical protein ABL949_09530 [Fimbriimonadaceae bacterium]